jgi:hypothetical protein
VDGGAPGKVIPTRRFAATSPLQGEVTRPACQHRVDQIVPRALIAKVDLQPVMEEGEEVGKQRLFQRESFWVADTYVSLDVSQKLFRIC